MRICAANRTPQRAEERRANKAKERQHEKSTRDQVKEKERMGKQMRKSLESVMTRRRGCTRGLLMAAADAEEARALRGQTSGGDAPTAPTTTATPSATATATATAGAPGAGVLQGAAVKAEEGATAAATTAAAAAAVTALLPAVHNAADLQLAARIAPFKQLSLSSDLLGAALQLWDFLQAFYPLLHLKKPPSLDELAGALASADAAAAVAATTTTAAASRTALVVSSSKSRLDGLRLLHKLGSKLAQLFAPSLLGALGLAMTAGEGEDDDVAADRAQRLAEQLSGLLTWEEVARLALQVCAQHALLLACLCSTAVNCARTACVQCAAVFGCRA
jgi:DDT domain